MKKKDGCTITKDHLNEKANKIGLNKGNTINLFDFHKNKKSVGICLGLVFIFYLLNVLSSLSKNVEVLKYFSIYTLADTRNIINNGYINPICIIASILITLFFISLSYIRYNKKELLN